MTVTVHRLTAFRDNYIWLVSDSHGRCVAVDPGDPVVTMLALEQLRLELVALLITHHHHDHTGGIIHLRSRFNIPVYGPSRESIPGVTHPLCEGDHFSILDNVEFVVTDVPGHTRGHIAFSTNNHMFLGDTLFGAGCGRLFDGTATELYTSLNKVAALPTSTLVYCAHEYTAANLDFAVLVAPDNDAINKRRSRTQEMRAIGQATVPLTLGEEMLTNPFLRCHLPEIQRVVQTQRDPSVTTPLEVFTALRRWKDEF